MAPHKRTSLSLQFFVRSEQEMIRVLIAGLVLLSFCTTVTGNGAESFFLRGGRYLSDEQLPVMESSAKIRMPSPGKAFLLSALVPGSGQLYMGQKRGWIYLAADIAAWTGYFIMDSKAQDIEDDYAAFAEEHYTLTNPDFSNDAERGWVEWWDLFGRLDADYTFADSVYLEYIVDDYENARENYYQEIAESNAYIYGWDDWAPDPYGNNDEYWGFDPDAGGLYFNYLSPNRDEFRSMRNEASDKSSWKNRFLGTAVLIRAVSAIDALRSARSRRVYKDLHVDVSWRKSEPAITLAWKGSIR